MGQQKARNGNFREKSDGILSGEPLFHSVQDTKGVPTNNLQNSALNQVSGSEARSPGVFFRKSSL